MPSKLASLAVLAFLVPATLPAARAEMPVALQEIMAMDAALDACRSLYPEPTPGLAVDRANCFTKAESITQNLWVNTADIFAWRANERLKASQALDVGLINVDQFNKLIAMQQNQADFYMKQRDLQLKALHSRTKRSKNS